MTMADFRTRFLATLLAIVLCLELLGCQAQEPKTALEVENLAKLCKVWGYVKYRHPVFLLGKKDWDEELLSLIPAVQEAETSDDVNELLHDWFVTLGEIDYGTISLDSTWLIATEESKLEITDTAWVADIAYIGEELAADLEQLADPIPDVDRSEAPIQFPSNVRVVDRLVNTFKNEGQPSLQYEDTGFRLLGLFRLWNIVEYYFPYLDLLDKSWEDYLLEYIPRMLEGTDQVSYELTVASLAFELHDPHLTVTVFDLESNSTETIADKMAGKYYFPVPLAEAEGKLVVSGMMEGCPLELGDVLLRINGQKIDVLQEERSQYDSYPRKDAILNRMRYLITRSETEDILVAVLRDGTELELSIKGGLNPPDENWKNLPSHQLLEENIGLINPRILMPDETDSIMQEFSNTDGLIIDLRQYPGDTGIDYYSVSRLPQYLLSEEITTFYFYGPSQAVPGTYVRESEREGYTPLYGTQYGAYYYDKPVVILMNNDETQSAAELYAETFRLNPNVVLMGDNSAGGNGYMVVFTLPGYMMLSMSGRRAVTVDGRVTQRTGIAPDIWVEPTIQGIAEGRDEVMEAAIEYLKNT